MAFRILVLMATLSIFCFAQTCPIALSGYGRGFVHLETGGPFTGALSGERSLQPGGVQRPIHEVEHLPLLGRRGLLFFSDEVSPSDENMPENEPAQPE